MGKTISSILALIVSLFVGGLLVQKLYYWFLIPVFTELPEISYSQAIGISMATVLFKSLTMPLKNNLYDVEETHIRAWFTPLIYLIYLGISYLVYLLI